MNKSNTSLKTTAEWKDINWRSVERRVFKLQKRIYRAAERGDYKAVRRLQKTLTNSWSAKAYAVRKVTQDNRGKKTAGVDGVKSVNNKARIKLIGELDIDGKAKPIRRVWIPKPGKTEKRPLGIPTMEDRAKQALLKLALEPEWEAKFEENSYGFRPGRGCHDAVEAIFGAIKQKPKYVLDADISKCFDKIDHEKLLTKLNTTPKFRRQIKEWLKCGVMEGNIFNDIENSTPQAGVISPLLANIALHGMENDLKSKFRRRKIGMSERGTQLNSVVPDFVRYADDFVILHKDLETVLKCKEFIEEWLVEMGLELKPENTSMTHTLFNHEGNTGFNFLGFNVKQFKVSENRSKEGFKTIITPSREAQKRQMERLHKVILDLKNASHENLIQKLNPILRGWCQYYSTVCSKETFSEMEHLMQIKLLRWSFRRHPKKSKSWVINKYWNTVGGDNWVFSNKKDGQITDKLMRHNSLPIKRHIKVKGSPYNGDWVYWSTRMGRHPEIPSTEAKLLKKQDGRCAHCGLRFRTDDLMEKDHITPKARGGGVSMKNLQLLHGHCHDIKTRTDGSCIHEKNHIVEERNEGKLSRSVLKTSNSGDRSA